MATDKRNVNFALGCIVIALVSTAATSIYLNSNRAVVRTAETKGTSGDQLPANHPPLDMVNRLTDLEQMSAKDPQNAPIRTQIANLYYDLNQYEKAAEFYQQSLKIHPKDPSVETDLATCFHNLGQDDRALEALNRVLSYSPRFSHALFNKGIVLVSGKKDIQAGIAVWEELLRSDPGFEKRAEIERTIRQLKASAK
jgi:tetratricopeptide (TPR) repeat protein